MGLKTTNYEAKTLGITLPEAYAIISKMTINGKSAVAEFAIQSTRENALDKPPIETKTLRFLVTRNENPFEKAYNIAKEKHTYTYTDRNTGDEHTSVIHGILYGWKDDIVDENAGLEDVTIVDGSGVGDETSNND